MIYRDIKAIIHDATQYCVDNSFKVDIRVCEISVYSFPQTWRSTALGFGGFGGQAITRAQTTVVVLEGSVCKAGVVFFDGDLAYGIEDFNDLFENDLHDFNMVSCDFQYKYKNKKLTK